MASRNARSLLQYWSHPHLSDGSRQPLPVRQWLGWIGVMLVLSMLGVGAGRLAVHLLGHAFPPDLAIHQMFVHASWGIALLGICEPILEELVFRAFMTRDAKLMSLGMGFTVAALGLVAVTAITGHRLTPHSDLVRLYFEHVAVLTAIALILAALTYRMRDLVRRWLSATAPAWIVSMTLLFAAAHALNFERGWTPWLLWLTLPQLMSGLVLAYLRVRHGLRWSIATHLAFDWLLIGIAWLQMGARNTGMAGHATEIVLVLAVIGLSVYGLVFLFRRGVLRPLPAMS